MQYVFPIGKARHYRFPTHVNDLVMDRAESKTSEVFVVVLEPGEAPPRHKHDDTEQVFHVIAGPVEATAIGNLLCQAMAIGQVGSLADARAIVRASFDVKHYEPRPDARWADAYERFRAVSVKS